MVYQGVADYEYRNGSFLFDGVMSVPRLSAFIFFLFCPSLVSMLEKIINLFAKPGWHKRAITSSGAQIHKVHQADFVWGRFWGIFLSLCSLRGGLIFCTFCYFSLV